MAGIHEAIVKVMNDVGAVGKDGRNDQGRGYRYRSIEAVMNALHPAMVKNGIFCAPQVLEQIREERQTNNGGTLIYSIIKVKYTFYAADGSNVEACVIGEGFDSGDKATNKAMSAAFKYACFQVFCIPTEEMIDSETESPDVKPKKKQEPKDAPVDKASEAQIRAIASICKKRGIDIDDLYGHWKTSPDACSKLRATQILTWLNQG